MCMVFKTIYSHFQLSCSLTKLDLRGQFVCDVVRSLFQGFLQHPFKLLEHARVDHSLCAVYV